MSPSPHHYTRSCVLDAPAEAVFDFHADPRNIVRISPPGQTAEIVRGGEPARAGSQFEFVVTLFGLFRLRWVGTWIAVERPGLLCDTAAPALFTLWEHRHEFEALPDGRTRLTDRLRYAMPGGMLGRLFAATVMPVFFAFMFADRQRRTEAWFRQPRSAG